MRVLLVSTYELGHQPLHVASPAAALLDAGHRVACLDLSVQPWDDHAVDVAEAVAVSVPMHTAMRLALPVAARVRHRRPGLPLCLYGLYAPMSRDLTLGRLADRVMAGEYEPALVAWVDALVGGRRHVEDPACSIHPGPGSGAGDRRGTGARPPARGRARSRPARHLLPPLERYARLALDGEERLVGCVEASHGCAHRCRHCPVPVVYDGRFRAVPAEQVLDDMAQLVDMGASHITFGDPDFLNGPQHSLRIVREMHRRFPALTFDCTTKIDHILQHHDLWPELARCGCLFVVSALESVNDAILARLDKGHTTAQAAAAIGLLRGHGIELRPSWLPFTPWTTLDDVLDLLDFVADHDLVANVDPVQYSIRLLLPEGSLLLDHPDLAPHLGPYDPERLTYTWAAADPRVDLLQARLAALVEAGAATGQPAWATFVEVITAARAAAGRRGSAEPFGDASALRVMAGSAGARPRLTEPWFCCAEPTESQLSPLGDT